MTIAIEIKIYTSHFSSVYIVNKSVTMLIMCTILDIICMSDNIYIYKLLSVW